MSEGTGKADQDASFDSLVISVPLVDQSLMLSFSSEWPISETIM